MANVKLTGRGTEAEKTKPHYNRAPVERYVMFTDLIEHASLSICQ
jgi:hypothetical protein